MKQALALALVAGVLAGALITVAALAGLDVVRVAAVLAALGIIAGCVILAANHFPWLVLLLLAVRPELDAVRVGGSGTAAAVGLIFIAAGGWWLVGRYRSGRLEPLTPASWGLLGLVVAAGLSALTSQEFVGSAISTTRLAAGVLMFVVLEQLIRSRLLQAQEVARAVAVSAGLVCAHVALQAVSGSAAVDESTGLSRVTGPFVHASVLGKYAAIVALLMFARAVWTTDRTRWLWTGGAAATTVAVALTYTRAAWFALALGVVVITARRDWRWLPALGVAGAAAFVFVPTLGDRITALWEEQPYVPGVPDNSFAWRMGYWQDLLPLGRINPLTGIGLDVVPTVRSEGLLPHNVWVQAWVEMGLVGVLALGACVVAVVVSLARAARAGAGSTGEQRVALEAAIAVAMGLVVVSLTENVLGETTTLWYAAAVMAVGWSPVTRSGGAHAGGPRGTGRGAATPHG